MTKMELHAYLEIWPNSHNWRPLIITHSIEEALNLSDRIYILKSAWQIVSEVKLDWSQTEDKEVQKIAYKRQILAIWD